MTVRSFRAALVAAGCAVAAMATGVVTLPAAAQGSGAGELITIPGTVPVWAVKTAKIAEAPGDQQRTVQVALALRDPAGAERLATQISTPGSPQYGRHLTAEQFTARFAPTTATVDQVRGWLTGRGLDVTDVAPNRHFVSVTGSVAELEAAFRVDLGVYRQPGGLRLTGPDRDVAVPRPLRDIVTAVLGLDDSGRLARPASDLSRVTPRTPAPETPAPKKTAQAKAAQKTAQGETAREEQYCARFWAEYNNTTVPQKYPAGSQSNPLCGYTTPQLRAIYGQTAANTGAGQHIAITGSYNLASLEADTNRWAAQSGTTPLRPGQYRVVPPPGGYQDNPNCDGPAAWNGEQAMDLQAAHAIAPAASVTWFAGADCTDNYAALNRAIADNTASVISNSWGAAGEVTTTPSIREQVGAMLVQAAIQGQAVLFASGDTGDTTTTEGKGTPQFPASHPWATGVGGTSVALGADNRVRFATGWEAAGNTLIDGQWVPQQDADGPFAGGATGGRSSLYRQPAYQAGVVPASYAQGRRTVPDIGALADSYTGFSIGYTTPQGWTYGPSGGTSLASPIVAALVVNAQQHHDVRRFGFLNTALYRMRTDTSAVTDVTPRRAGVWTSGMRALGEVVVPDQPGNYLVDFDTKPQTLQSGPGWDPVTGVGTPAPGFVAALGTR